jgi:hypothetical protein
MLSGTITAAALMTMPTGCKPKGTVLSSSLSTTVGDREIKASIDGPAFMQPETDAVTVRFGTHQVRVEKERLLLDGKERAKIPAAAMHVEVMRSKTTLTVTAEGTNILTTKIAE